MADIDIKAQAVPIGWLPEPSYGVPLQGTTVNGPHSGGDTSILIHATYDPNNIIGCRIGIGSSTPNHVVVNCVGNTITISPGLSGATPDDTPVIIFYNPFPHYIEEMEPEEEDNKDVYGTVGSGTMNMASSKAGKDVQLSYKATKGRDLFRFYPAKHPKSSILAHIYSEDGVITFGVNQGMVNAIRKASGKIASFTMLYGTKTGELRMALGCVFVSLDEEFPEEMDGFISLSGEIQSQRVIDTDEATILVYKLAVCPYPYLSPILQAHGSCRIKFGFESALRENHDGISATVKLFGTAGFKSGDQVKVFGPTIPVPFIRSIVSVDHINKTVLLSAPLGMVCVAIDTIIGHDATEMTTWNVWEVKSLKISNKSGAKLVGNISLKQDYKSNKYALALEAEADLTLRRDALTYRDMMKETTSYTRLLMCIVEYEASADIGVQAAITRIYRFGIVNSIKEKVDDKRDEIVDEMTLKMAGWPNMIEVPNSVYGPIRLIISDNTPPI